MKKFKFFALAFAALSFAACSDDAIDGKGGNTGTAGDATPAYLTISFSANSGNSSRSTADDANNNGDDHSTDAGVDDPGNGEDSGHYNDGTEAERKVDNVLVVIAECNASGQISGNTNFAKLYSTQTATDKTDGNFTIIDQAGGTYVNNEPIELAVGTYNVLVVANPVIDLLTEIQTAGDLNVGIRNNNAVQDLYRKITEGNYNPEERFYQNIAAGVSSTSGDDFKIMMANKGLSTTEGKAYTVELTTTNSDPKTPATANVEVERVLSKITYREKDDNVYEVHPRIGVVRAERVEGAVPNGTPDGYKRVDLNVATDLYGNEVYVLIIEEKEGEKIYTVYGKDSGNATIEDKDYPKYKVLTAQAVTEQDIIDKDNNPLETDCYAVADIDSPEASLTYVADKEETLPTVTWYVRLEGYALVNLSKNVHYVRHIISNADGENPFGKLNGSNYLYTPFWNEKNRIVFTEDLEFPTGVSVNDWFYNTLADVTEESKVLKITTNENVTSFARSDGNPVLYYKPMSSLGEINEDDQEVTGSITHGSGEKSPNIGDFMAYCFENSTDLEHQTHGLSTGISFVARMYKDKDLKEPVERLYRYGNNLFESLSAIQNTYGADFMSQEFNELVKKESSNTFQKSDLETLAATHENIELYNDNVCYYYTTEIKHFDNGDNAVLGNMEFAIMRNNIYSLSVTDINMIGDPQVDPTPGIPDENPNQDLEQLNVQVEILPWIVRYNDIEF